jgi:dihydroorotase
MHADILFRGGICVLPGMTCQADIAVQENKIVALGDLGHVIAPQEVDARGLHILPGLIDTQVHFREPGGEHKETLANGMKSAAMGGITGIFEMPNTNPLTTTPQALEDKLHRASKDAWTNYAFYFGGTEENATHLPTYETLPGVCGVKIFMGSSTGSLLTETDDVIEKVLSNGRRVVAAHAEDEAMMRENKKTILGDSTDVRMHPVWRSEESCLSATQRLVKLAHKTGRRVHVLHVTTAQEINYLAQHKDIASVEVLANHLTLHAPECYEKLGSHAQQNPPIREKHHQDALWAGIENGIVDILASDHAPHTLEEKSQTYPNSPSGTPGVQTLVPIMLNHVNNGKLTLERLVDLMAYGPQRIHGLVGKGRLAVGYDADLTIVDLKKKKTFSNDDIQSVCGWTPFDGETVTGTPVMTVINGHIVMRDNELTGMKAGHAYKFYETIHGS